MAEYIEREATASAIRTMQQPRRPKTNVGLAFAVDIVNMMPAADVAPVQRWIPVTERLPEDGVPVLICGDQNAIDIGTYFSEFGHWYDWNSIRTFVHHWYPIPEPPKEG